MTLSDMSFADTIFALATPQGRSAVQIIRISGKGSAQALKLLAGDVPQPRQAKFASLRLSGDEDGVIDQALVLYFASPASATGEDTAELHLHGSPILSRMVMEWLAKQPEMRLAEPGEFTRRAFLNNKINLDQAEGIADIIDADTVVQHKQAIRQLDGALSAKTEEWRGMMIALSAELEALIDFADEDLPDDVVSRVKTGISQLSADMNKALATAEQGVIQRDGLRVAILGRPNAGKSTLLNRLTGDDRAIVSPEAGTTRDLVEVSMNINGMAVHLTDTAGIRYDAGENIGAVEQEGVRRALRAAVLAQIVFILVDGHEESPHAVLDELTQELSAHAEGGLPKIIPVLSKADALKPEQLLPDWIMISAQTGLGMPRFDKALSAVLEEIAPHGEAPILTRQRHISAVTMAADALIRSEAINFMEAPELLAEELRVAAQALGRITGRVDVEDLLDHIFSSFCIGK